MTDNTLELQQDEKQFSLVKDAFDRLIANKLAVVGMLLVLFPLLHCHLRPGDHPL